MTIATRSVNGGVLMNAMLDYVIERQVDAHRTVYLTDTLKYVAENTCREFGGASPKHRFADIIPIVEQDTRTGEEIAEQFSKKAGLVVRD